MKRIGIIGAGFSGISVAANLYRSAKTPIEIYLFDKSGSFGEGEAYRTSFAFHLLNVRARDMSAFEDQPAHFIDWLKSNPETETFISKQISLDQQFLPRLLYKNYLKYLLEQIEQNTSPIKLKKISGEVVDVEKNKAEIRLTLINSEINNLIAVDKLVFALGNQLPQAFSFPVPSCVKHISNTWDYEKIQEINPASSVLIIGTGLSMIDTILSLRAQQHTGQIYAVSRHGLLPLPHSDSSVKYSFESASMPKNLRMMTKVIRQHARKYQGQEDDWRSVVNGLRDHLSLFWQQASTKDKHRFIRHVLPYWNIHRHRVHQNISKLLDDMIQRGELKIMAGRLNGIKKNQAMIGMRRNGEKKKINIDCLVNCTGSGLHALSKQSKLIQSLLLQGVAKLDELNMGLEVSDKGSLINKNGEASSRFYSLGPPVKGVFWECTAVPEIRKYSQLIASELLKDL